MTRRIRTAKQLGTRHDRNYFKHWSTMRRWRFYLSSALVAAGLLWLGFSAVRGSAAPYSAGPISPPHNVFANNCETCHAGGSGLLATVGFKKSATDEACLQCHAAPRHSAHETFTPSCATCHMEHRGEPNLARVNDKFCVQCHSDLQVTAGEVRVAANIARFNNTHPEFAAVKAGMDPGGIKFNHAAHMRTGLQTPNGPVDLTCNDCHRPAAEAGRPWPYQATDFKPSAQVVIARGLPPGLGRAHMADIRYGQNCASCHSLQFDERIAEQAPHDKPEVVMEFVRRKLREHIAANPQLVGQPMAPRRNIPRGTAPRVARSADEWVAMRTADAEELLWRKTCVQCHTLEPQPEAAPTVRAANLVQRWMPNAKFSHYSHEGLACASCHVQATSSQAASDVLLPGVASCQNCHNGVPTRMGQADNRCFMCHQYHDWMQRDSGGKGKFNIHQLTAGMMPRSSTGF